MKRARHFSLKARLAALTGCSAIAVLALGSITLYRDLEHQISAAITAELTVRTSDVASVFLQDRNEANADLPVVAQVIDQSGQVLSPAGQTSLLQPTELAAALDGQFVVDRRVDTVGDHARVLALPVDARRGRVVIVAATTTEPLEAARSRLLILLGVGGPSLALAITAVAWLLAQSALRPVQRMAREAETISLAEPGRRLPQPAGHDEIADLGRTLNQMLSRIESNVARERAFIDDASHELRTPLAVLRGELELAAQRPDDAEDVRVGLASALEETDRLARLADDLLTLARADAGQVQAGDEQTDLFDAVQSAVERLRRDDHVAFELTGEHVVVHGERRTVEQIVTNLVTNAARYAHHKVAVSVDCHDSTAQLVVADDGPGFPPDLLPHALERFTRGDSSRGRTGTGLGLAIVSSLTSALGGHVAAANGPPLGGASVTVKLPSVGATDHRGQ
ncbi:MAG: ATP-binding protein [Acidimicrobiales bacterium]